MVAVAKGLLSDGANIMETATTLPEINRAQEIDSLGIKLYFWSRNPYDLRYFFGNFFGCKQIV